MALEITEGQYDTMLIDKHCFANEGIQIFSKKVVG